MKEAKALALPFSSQLSYAPRLILRPRCRGCLTNHNGTDGLLTKLPEPAAASLFLEVLLIAFPVPTNKNAKKGRRQLQLRRGRLISSVGVLALE